MVCLSKVEGPAIVMQHRPGALSSAIGAEQPGSCSMTGGGEEVPDIRGTPGSGSQGWALMTLALASSSFIRPL